MWPLAFPQKSKNGRKESTNTRNNSFSDTYNLFRISSYLIIPDSYFKTKETKLNNRNCLFSSPDGNNISEQDEASSSEPRKSRGAPLLQKQQKVYNSSFCENWKNN